MRIIKKAKAVAGLVHVYTGDGKGKTTAAWGLAVRAISYKRKVLIIQFIKGPWQSGELRLVKKFKPYLSVRIFGQGFVRILSDKKPLSMHRQAANKAFSFAQKAVSSNKYDLIILDEISIAIKEGLVGVDQVVKLIKKKSAKLELVLTGRSAPVKIKKLADYVSEIKMIKHPFSKGILARQSIDF